MNFKFLKSLLFTVLCGIWAFGATAATPIFSDYGQVQNVQFYSTNPFWTPNSPYNRRIPQPVYVQGADLNTEDCMNVVQSLVYVQCLARNNCRDTSLSDIRPTIMVQLSNLPGNNYVSACAGYIDGIYEAFVKQYGNSVPTRAVDFPDATTPNPNIQNMNISPQRYNQNSYQPTNNKKIPDWQSAIKERTRELIELQNQNGADSYDLSATDFPATIADLSFESQIALKTDGYEPFMGKSAYVFPMIKGQDEFCSKYPDDPRCPKEEKKEEEKNDKGDEGKKDTPPQDTEKDCTDEMKNSATDDQKTLIKKAVKIDGVCKITECNEDNGIAYVASADGQTCEDPVDRRPGTDCSDSIPYIISHATKITWDTAGKCVVSECEDGWQPNNDGSACRDADEYYTIAICWSSADNEHDYHWCNGSFYEKNKCFPVCNQNENNNTPVAKELKSLFDSTKTYCVPKYDYTSTDVYTIQNKRIDLLSVIDKSSNEQVRFTDSDKVNKIAERMYLASDRIPENQGNSKPCDAYPNGYNLDVIILKHVKGDIQKAKLIRIDD